MEEINNQQQETPEQTLNRVKEYAAHCAGFLEYEHMRRSHLKEDGITLLMQQYHTERQRIEQGIYNIELKDNVPDVKIKDAAEYVSEILEEPKDPIGDFILANATKGMQTQDGMYYHYSEVCSLLNKFSKRRIEAQQPAKSLQECKDEYARTLGSMGYANWESLQAIYIGNQNSNLLVVHCFKVAELYANQFQAVIADKDTQIEHLKDKLAITEAIVIGCEQEIYQLKQKTIVVPTDIEIENNIEHYLAGVHSLSHDSAYEYFTKHSDWMSDRIKELNNNEQVEQWIDFNTRKPNPDQLISVLWPGENWHVEARQLSEKQLLQNWSGLFWFPLPQPPLNK